MTTVEHFIIQRCGGGRQRKTYEGRGEQRDTTDIIKHRSPVFCSNTLLNVTFLFLQLPPTVFLSLLSSHIKTKTKQKHAQSFCGYSILTVFATLENPKRSLSLCVWWVGGPSVRALWLFARQTKKKKKKSLLECGFLNLQCIFDC